jgi:hypothetical protein
MWPVIENIINTDFKSSDYIILESNTEYESRLEPILDGERVIGMRNIIYKKKPKYTDKEIVEIILKHFQENLYRRC